MNVKVTVGLALISLSLVISACESKPDASSDNGADEAQAASAESSDDGKEKKAKKKVEGPVKFASSTPVSEKLGGPVSSMVVSPDGKFAYAASKDGGSIMLLSRDQSSGALEPSGDAVALEEDASPHSLHLSEDGSQLLVVSDGSPRSSAKGHLYEADPEAGTLEFEEKVSGVLDKMAVADDHAYKIDGFDIDIYERGEAWYEWKEAGKHTVEPAEGATRSDPRTLIASPDGKHLYVVALDGVSDGDQIRTGDMRLVGYAVDPKDGSLEQVQSFADGTDDVDIETMSQFLFSADGQWLYPRYFDLTLMKRDASTGKLTVEATQDVPSGEHEARFATMGATADGGHLYMLSNAPEESHVLVLNHKTAAK